MSSTIDTAVRECRQFIGGEWVEASDGRTYEDRDPFTGDVVSHVAARVRRVHVERVLVPGGVHHAGELSAETLS